MSDLCGSPTSVGHSCGYPPNACPLHVRVWQQPDPETAPGHFDRNSLGPIAASVITRLSDGLLTPLDANRWLRAIATFVKLPVTDDDQERILREIELRGVVMNGFPPRDEEEWALAEKVFDAEAITEFHRWEETGHGW